MKRDMDLVREILIMVEAEVGHNTAELMPIDFSVEQKLKMNAHLKLLVEDADLLHGQCYVTMNREDVDWIDLELSWRGHEYLDNIRDPEVWRQAKESADKVGGFSLEVLGALAKGLIKEKIKSHTGINIDL